MNTNTWSGNPADLAAAYAHHSTTLRGALRHALVTRALLSHLPHGSCSVLDIGGGTGEQAIALARAGHTVTVLDPDPAMVDQARDRASDEPEETVARITLTVGPGELALDLVGDGYDAVLCHGVLMYVDDPEPLLQTLVAAAAPGGVVSVLAKSDEVLAFRPALEGRWADALAMLDTNIETGNFGVTSRGVDRDDVTARLSDLGAATLAWYGVRTFTDHLGNAPVPPDFDQILELEWRAGARDPYRQISRLWHLIARKAPA
ncbi:methyltransferase domain-containing protein [Yinghuangia aomiensis]|uniref:Methyltransferase domain-containing protein n=1 Tax=Yinghuangia aomiensis TaxID=676205 RepID=A0ABP9IC81_9ACTN